MIIEALALTFSFSRLSYPNFSTWKLMMKGKILNPLNIRANGRFPVNESKNPPIIGPRI